MCDVDMVCRVHVDQRSCWRLVKPLGLPVGGVMTPCLSSLSTPLVRAMSHLVANAYIKRRFTLKDTLAMMLLITILRRCAGHCRRISPTKGSRNSHHCRGVMSRSVVKFLYFFVWLTTTIRQGPPRMFLRKARRLKAIESVF